MNKASESPRVARPVFVALLLALAVPAGVLADGIAGRSIGSRMKEMERRALWEGMREREFHGERQAPRLAPHRGGSSRFAARRGSAGRGVHARPAARAHSLATHMETPREPLASPAPTAVRSARLASLAALAPNVRVNNPSGDSGGNIGQSEASIAALGTDVLAAWNDGEGFFLSPPSTQGYGYSTDGGGTFTDGGIPPVVPGWNWSSDPIVSVNEKTGVFYYAAMMDSGSTTDPAGRNGLGVVSGTFAGSSFTWGTPHLVRRNSNSTAFLDKPWMCADSTSGNVYVTYTSFGVTADTIDFQRSTNGIVWTDPVHLSANSDAGLVQGSRVQVGPAGEVQTVWYAIGTDTSGTTAFQDFFRARRSTSQGVTWGAQSTVAGIYSNFGSGAPGFNRENGITFPSLGIDRTHGAFSGRMYVGWNESVNFYTGNYGAGGSISENVPDNGFNNVYANAKPFTLNATLRGALPTSGETDMFKFTGGAGQTVVLYVDSLDTSLDMSLRLVCGDTTSFLAYSEPGAGSSNLIVFTLPVAGSYYVRCKNFGGAGGYRIRSGTVGLLPGRARDHRDAFVASSSDGSTWNTPVRVSNSPAGYDDWLPEVAVSGPSAAYGDGHVYAIWYDWRDANPSTCGAVSHVYMARSDNGGASWSEVGAVTDQQTAWSQVNSNIAPNQGDYLGLFANGDAVYPVWADGRSPGLNPDVYTVTLPLGLTPTEAALVSATAQPDHVTLVWYDGGDASALGTVQKSLDGTSWQNLGAVLPDGTGRLTYVDRDVTPGGRYAYRLAISGSSGAFTTAPTWVDVPVRARFALEGARPNPSLHGLTVGFALPDGAPATLALYDLAGRRLRAVAVGTLGAGDHVLRLDDGLALGPGVYLVRLTRGGESLVTRATLVR